jgi:hypothetical protein
MLTPSGSRELLLSKSHVSLLGSYTLHRKAVYRILGASKVVSVGGIVIVPP